MSIRIRLTLWYALVLVAGLALFAGAVLWQTARQTSASLDETLRQRAADVRDDLRIGRGVTLRSDAPNESNRQLGEVVQWVRVLDARGRAAILQGPRLPLLPAGALSDPRPGLRTWTASGASPEAGSVRIDTLPVVVNGRRVATIQVLTTTHGVEEVTANLLRAMELAGAAIVLLGALSALFLADRALRPVDRITRLADEIGDDDLHRRVSVEVWGPEREVRDELGRLARTFDAMLDRLQEARERRRRLTADVAHELGTPIATISSGAEIALRRPREAEEYRAALRHIMDESRHLDRVVDDLLTLTRADANALTTQCELVEIDEVCRQAVAALRPLAVENAIAMDLDLPPHAVLVMGDELRLGQVVRNLLDNALRHTPRDGQVTLTLRQERGEDAAGAGPTVVVRVDDSGPGIPTDELAHVFERFHRVPTAPLSEPDGKRRRAGSGLGLAICKAIVRAHGGRIWAERDSRPGAHLVVALPGLAPAESAPSSAEQEGNLSRERV